MKLQNAFKKILLNSSIFSAAVLCFSFSLSASAQLSDDQQAVVIQELNDYCADSWCESAVEFNFQRIICSDQTTSCDLYFTTQDNSTNDQPIFNQVCHLQPLNKIEQMISYKGSLESTFTSLGLKDSFVEQVDACAEQFFH